jgi:hypothetical protein
VGHIPASEPRVEALPYYKWLWRDFRSNRKVQRMGWAARGLLRELLDEAWAEGSIPNDVSELADICGCPVDVMTEAWPRIEPCWRPDDSGRWVDDKLESMRTEADSKRILKVSAGRLGGLAKLQHKLEAANASQEDLSRVKQAVAGARQQLADARPVVSAATECHIAIAIAEHKQEQEQAAAPLVVSATERDIAPDVETSPDEVACAVMAGCGIAGMHTRRVLQTIVLSISLRPGYSPDATRGMLIAAWQRYEQLKPELRITWGAEKFFGDGHWRTPDAWPRKEEGRKRPFDPCARQEAPVDMSAQVFEIKSGDMARWHEKRARGEEIPAVIAFALDRKTRSAKGTRDANDTTKTA